MQDIIGPINCNISVVISKRKGMNGMCAVTICSDILAYADDVQFYPSAIFSEMTNFYL